MIVVLSPAKSLDYDTPAHVPSYTQPAFVDDASELIDGLRKLSPQDIATLMDISDKLAALGWTVEDVESFMQYEGLPPGKPPLPWKGRPALPR